MSTIRVRAVAPVIDPEQLAALVSQAATAAATQDDAPIERLGRRWVRWTETPAAQAASKDQFVRKVD